MPQSGSRTQDTPSKRCFSLRCCACYGAGLLGAITIALVLAVASIAWIPGAQQLSFYKFWQLIGPPSARASLDIRQNLLSPHSDQLGGATVLEIGPGLGANLPVYALLPPPRKLILAEPNEWMHDDLEDQIANHSLRARGTDVMLIAEGAQALDSVQDASVDVVVSTLVLCSVPSVDAALNEIHRVLRPGGIFVFLEHVLAAKEGEGEGEWLQAVQRGVQALGLWTLLGDGCTLTRETGHTIMNREQWRANVRRMSMPGVPFLLRPHVLGHAVKQQHLEHSGEYKDGQVRQAGPSAADAADGGQYEGDRGSTRNLEELYLPFFLAWAGGTDAASCGPRGVLGLAGGFLAGAGAASRARLGPISPQGRALLGNANALIITCHSWAGR